MDYFKDYFKAGATLERVSTLKDGSVRAVFDTQEMDQERMATLFGMRKEIGHLIFARPNTTIEIPETAPKGIKDPPNMKKRSLKMRNIIYRIWESSTHKDRIDSESYYNSRMDRIIDELLEELE